MVFQSFGLLPALSAVENVELPLRVNGVDLAEARERAEGWLQRLGPETRMHNRTYELSAGQQQRVAVARALIPEPEIVMADEPIAEVDTENADVILEALWDVIRRDGAVLAATHNPEALRYANRVVLFRDGVVEQEGTPQEVAGHLTRRLTEPSSLETDEVSEPEGLADVLAGGAEDLAVDVDHASVTAMPQLPSDRPGHGITSGVADPLVQVQVAHRVRDDG